jgi:hypothetical protein
MLSEGKRSPSLLGLQSVPQPTEKKPLPPEDVIQEDSGPPITDVPKPTRGDVQVDVDDAMIEESKDDVFKKDQGITRQRR